MLLNLALAKMDSKEIFKTAIGQNLRRLRTSRKLSLEKLALESGMAYSQVSRIELGKILPSAYTLYILAKTLNVSPAEFFNFCKTETLHAQTESN